MLRSTDISELVTLYSTPLWVVGEAQLRQTIRRFVSTFYQFRENVQIAYSYKTNPLLAICQIMYQEGLWAEVVSGDELYKACNIGVPYSQIIFNGPGKADEELKLAIKEGVILNVDNWFEMERVKDIASSLGKTAAVGLRISTGYPYIWGTDSKFGFDLGTEEIHRAIAKVQDSDVLLLEGLHFHLGTNITEVESYRSAIADVCKLTQECISPKQQPLRYIDVGGGFPVETNRPYQVSPQDWQVPDLKEFAKAICQAVNSGFSEETLLLMEPGRALVADSTLLVAKVVDVKSRKDELIAVVDGGLNLFSSVYYTDHPCEIIPTAKLSEPNSLETEKQVNLFGCLCMPDSMGSLQESRIPRVGDLVIWRSMGAYNYSESFIFSRGKPPVVLWREDGSSVVIRDKQPYDALSYLECSLLH